MTAVHEHATRGDMDLARLVLWAAAIPYAIEAVDAGGVRLLVDDADAEDARVLLSDNPRTNGREQS